MNWNNLGFVTLFVVVLLCLIPSNLTTNYDDDETIDDYDNDEDYDDDDDDYSNYNTTTNNSTLIFTKELTNITKDLSTTKLIKLICIVQNLLLDQSTTNQTNNNNNNKITFKWLKNLIPIEKNNKKYTIRTIKENNNIYRSTLKITKLEMFDSGFYECIANNGLNKIRSQGVLKINSDNGRWTNTASISTLKIDGMPSSFDEKTTILPNAAAIYDFTSVKTNKKDITKQFDLNLDGSPINNLTNLNLNQQTLNNNNNNNVEEFCQIYHGETCKEYLTNKYVFVQPPFTQNDIEQKLTQSFLVISMSNDISSSCNKFAQPSLCYSAFPLCNDPFYVNTYQKTLKSNNKFNMNNKDIYKKIRNILASSLNRICKHDCLLLETELCSKEYAIAKRHPVIGKTLELEECEFLPNETEKNSINCLSLGVGHQSVNKDDTCYWDNGEYYRGVQDTSDTNKKCLRWSHQFHIPLSEHPELIGHNYCRNPGGVEVQPFCFVDQNNKELCGITKCAQMVGLYVIVSFLIISATFGLIIAIFCCRRKSKIGRNLQNIPVVDKNIYGNHGPNSPMEMNSLLPTNIQLIQQQQQQHNQRNNLQTKNNIFTSVSGNSNSINKSHSSKLNYQNLPQYTYKELIFIEELGEGAFGKVYKGELKLKNNGGNSTNKIFVACKSLKENASPKTQNDFQREIELISELKHPNIICLMGVVIKQEPMCMLFEFMSEGDLHEFLINNSPNENKNLTQNQFLHIAIQIAQGMEYLSDNHYVHRDLAARNCLVSKDLIVKISDFGLSRDMYSCDYYRVQSKSLLPVRWMPPESILYGKFTTESDVWSYGVVLWEIFSYGLQPYYGYNNQEVINMIRSRKLLPCPDVCPSYCYSLMVECWAELAIRRPSFGEISHRLRVWKQSVGNNTTNTGGVGGVYFRTTPIDNYNIKYNTTGGASGCSSSGGGGGGGGSSSGTGCGGGGGYSGGISIVGGCSSDTTQTLCPSIDNKKNMTWERTSSNNLKYGQQQFNESQSSLNSRTSSLGNKTQSTNLSMNDIVKKEQRNNTKYNNNNRKHLDEQQQQQRKNIVVSCSNGENFETKITQ